MSTAQLGVYTLPASDNGPDGISPWTFVTGFTAWKNFDFGIYIQVPYSVQIDNVVLIDNGEGLHPMIYQPDATSHQSADKSFTLTNSVFIGASAGMDCDDSLDLKDKNMVNSKSGRGMRTETDGRVSKINYVLCKWRGACLRKMSCPILLSLLSPDYI